jgi:hypothetical protein
MEPRIDSDESIPPGWELIPGLLKKFTNTGCEVLVTYTPTCTFVPVTFAPYSFDPLLKYFTVGCCYHGYIVVCYCITCEEQ